MSSARQGMSEVHTVRYFIHSIQSGLLLVFDVILLLETKRKKHGLHISRYLLLRNAGKCGHIKRNVIKGWAFGLGFHSFFAPTIIIQNINIVKTNLIEHFFQCFNLNGVELKTSLAVVIVSIHNHPPGN